MNDSPLRVSPQVASIVPPAIDVFNRRVSSLKEQGVDVINLAQGVADFTPMKSTLDQVASCLASPWMHVYSHDAGLLSVREAVARFCRSKGLDIDPKGELLLTAGASQAFFMALITLAAPGDTIVLPSPYYFDHQYAITAAGMNVVEAPMRLDGGIWRFDIPALAEHAARGARLIVLVSPNNPTGALLEADELEELSRGLAGTGTAVLSDETYDCFVFADAPFVSPAAVMGLKERTVVIGSFSKNLGMAGWRIGYLFAPAPVIEQALKIQDSMVICAPVVSQKAVEAALARDVGRLVEKRRLELMKRCAVLRQGLEGIDAFEWIEPRGAFFAFPGLAGLDDAPLADELLEKAHVAVMPGSAFGPAGRGFLRISFGNVDAARLREACARFRSFFGQLALE